MNQPATKTPESPPALLGGDRLDAPTFHERYQAMPESFQAELIAETVYVSSPVSAEHGRAHAALMFWLGLYAASTPRAWVFDNATVRLDDRNEVQPDAVVCIDAESGGRARVEQEYLVGSPDLVVEVSVSTASRDLQQKRTEYEAAGVPEYLVIDLQRARVLWLQHDGELYTETKPDHDGVFRSRTLPGLWLDSDAFLKQNSQRVIETLRAGLNSEEHARFVQNLGPSPRQS